MFQRRPAAERVTCLLLWAVALVSLAKVLPAQPAPVATPIAVYADGKAITFTPAAGRPKGMFVVGDAVLGPLLADRKPKDHRPNLYVVAPGAQYQGELEGAEPFAFNLIVSAVPRTEEAIAWDVYWALVLDPTLQSNFIGERELLLAAQETFAPEDSFSFSDMPAAGLLRAYLHIDSLDGLERFRRPDGALPRIVIIPAQSAVRASAVDPDAPSVCVPEGRISRALSAWAHRCNASAEKSGHASAPSRSEVSHKAAPVQ